MSLRGYVKKGKPAMWCSAFPSQVKQAAINRERTKKMLKKQRKPVRRVSKAKAKSDRVYNARVRAWLVGKRCIVFPERPATQCHHKFGRNGRLKLWEPGWRPVSDEGHDFIHRNPEEATLRGFIGPEGTWNDYERAWRHEQSIVTENLRSALEKYKEHHERGCDNH